MSDPQVFALPDVGEGLTEADIVSWMVAVGDKVDVNDVLLEVETAKSVVELPSPYAGVVVALHAAAGETLPVGAPLVSIGSEVPASSAPSAPPPEAPAVPDAAPPVTLEAASPVAAPTVATVPAPVDDRPPAGADDSGEAQDTREKPLILVGTGPKEAASRRIHVRRPDPGRVDGGRNLSRAPVGPGLDEVPSDTPPANGNDHEDRRLPIKGVRKATAQAMVRSAFTAPHATVWTTVDVTRTMEAVRRLKVDRAWSGVRVSPLVFVARAVALAVKRYPDVNATWDGDANEIVVKGQLNLGIAAATPRGLLVPNVKDAGSMGLRELAEAVQDVVVRARDGKLAPPDMARGTLTLTNVGTFGIEGAAPIINPPEAVIVSIGAVNLRPWVVDGVMEPREVMTISIAVDHRLVDGQLAGEVLRFIAEILSDPGATFVLS